ncbi:hypothetical protein KLEB273_gp179 [Bacillus phage vB_BauM_KLEB27-3]|nr:hypothetical protein KLEB273_gp179 [Bacillus phage vB_BauM_KLEB27-3]
MTNFKLGRDPITLKEFNDEYVVVINYKGDMFFNLREGYQESFTEKEEILDYDSYYLMSNSYQMRVTVPDKVPDDVNSEEDFKDFLVDKFKILL